MGAGVAQAGHGEPWPLPMLTPRSTFLVQQNFTLRCLQISSFFNSSCARTDSSAWLGDLQTHRWSNASDTIQFLRPWSQGTFSNQQWQKLQRMFQVYRFSFTRDIQELVKMFPEGYPHCEWRGGALNKYPVGERGPRIAAG